MSKDEESDFDPDDYPDDDYEYDEFDEEPRHLPRLGCPGVDSVQHAAAYGPASFDGRRSPF